MKLMLKTEIQEFIYDTREEKEKHKIEMEKDGFEDSGQAKYNVNRSFSDPDHQWYGGYYKYSK